MIEKVKALIKSEPVLVASWMLAGLSAFWVSPDLKYIDYIPDIILEPDYIGMNPNEAGKSIELIKRYENNVLVGIKLDSDGEYLYVSTMHDVQESKIIRRLHSGRIKEFSIDKDENK